MRIPSATYRIQFNPEFGFEQAQAIASYLADLGISDLYASPIFKARLGSTHGYDVVDATQLNPELGGSESFTALAKTLKTLDIGWLQDIVPNHMAYCSENAYLMDALEHGPDSSYANYFDLCWNSPFGNSQERILAPLLGNFYGTSLENGEIQLDYDPNGLSVTYYNLRLPLRLESYTKFLTHNLGQLNRTLGRDHPDFIKLLGILYLLRAMPSEVTGQQREDQIAFVKGLLWDLYRSNEAVCNFIEGNLNTFNGDSANPESYNLLDDVLNDQFYRLAFWKVGAEEMNYRRFFTVNELISVKVEDLKVFNHTHSLIETLVKQGDFTGLRIDHIDGLYDPAQYLERLREKVGETYITVEKILERTETLPEAWPIQGTSGYDFLNYVNGIFCQQAHESRFDDIYFAFLGYRMDFATLVSEKKQLILERNLAGDVDNLATLLKNISSKYRYANDFTINGLKRAIAAVLTSFPIYRTYVSPAGIDESDRHYLQQVIQAAKQQTPLLQHELTFIEKLMRLEFDDNLTQTEREQWLYFVMRMQQYSGPLMAKGVEDTALYVYNRLLSLNEVGGDPAHFGVSVADFHAYNQQQQQQWPHTMNTTATHDTKRGEDMRARLNVLSELPDEWESAVFTWSGMNRQYRSDRNGLPMPDRNDEYFLYQTLVGAFPFAEAELPSFQQRVKDYLIKAIREAKVHTAWLRPDEEYEAACLTFIEKILDPAISSEFLESFGRFQQKVAEYGMWNSLSQMLLKLVAPGVPDIYQGTELWELSMVDPDNRRPVDYTLRQSWLDEIQAGMKADPLKLVEDLLRDRTSGKVKLMLMAQVLQARQAAKELFRDGRYIPLTAHGSHANHVVAFARQHESQMAIALVPRFLASLIAPNELPLGESVWHDTQLQLPDNAPTQWKDAITGRSLQTDAILPVGQALAHVPVALLVSI